MRTIEQLNTLLEELEKRIRNISTAQSTLSQINAICTYIANVQDYLQKLNTAFDTHVQECDDYTDDINNLQSQIDNISESINSLISDDKTIQQIQTSLAELQAEIEAFVGNSSTTAETLQNDISALQTDLGSCQDDIADVESEISAINSSIGEQNTTITNLQTTQTNLQTTQSSQASTINNINSRLTTAENNISTLTGGVDVSEIDNRIDSLEASNGPTCAHETYDFHDATPTNFTLFTHRYYYSCSTDDTLYQKMKLRYVSSGEGTLTITLFEEKAPIGKVYTVDLSKHPYEFEFNRQFLPEKKSNNLQLQVVSTTQITFQTFDIWLFGKNVYLYNYDQEIKVTCFDGCIYLTRYYDDHIAYGKFSTVADIDLDNLPYTYNYSDSNGCYTYMQFMPFIEANSSGYTSKYDETILAQRIDDNSYTVFYAPSSELHDGKILHKTGGNSSNGAIAITNVSYPIIMPDIQNQNPIFINMTTSSGGSSMFGLSSSVPGSWFCCYVVGGSTFTMETPILSYIKIKLIALNEDGNLYYLTNKTLVVANPVCKGGKFLTAYLQPDGTINVYVSHARSVDKYILTPYSEGSDYFNTSFSETYTDCTLVYELLDTHLLKNTSSGWVICERT